MQLTSLVAASLAVASTNAILLPPDVSIADEDTFSILPHLAAGDDLYELALGKETNVKLNCPGCPVRKYHRTGKTTTHTNLESHLELDFSIAQVNGHDALLINGLPLFPTALAMNDEPLTARLLPDFKKKNHDFVQPPDPETLGFSLLARPVREDPETQMELFAIDLQIIEVGNVFVQGIQTVEALVLKTPSNKLVLVEVNTMEPEPPVAAPPSGSTKECSSLLCEVTNMFKGVFSDFGSFKPCANSNKPPALTGEIVGDADEAFREPSAGHGRPGHHGHHGHGYGHGHHDAKHHNWGHMLGSIASQILLPIAFGVFAGVSASV